MVASKRPKRAEKARRSRHRMPSRMGVSQMTAKGQVTISADLRKALGLHPGDRVRMTLSESGALRVERIRSWDEIAQALPLATIPPIDWKALRKELDEEMAEEVFRDLGDAARRRSDEVS